MSFKVQFCCHLLHEAFQNSGSITMVPLRSAIHHRGWWCLTVGRLSSASFRRVFFVSRAASLRAGARYLFCEWKEGWMNRVTTSLALSYQEMLTPHREGAGEERKLPAPEEVSFQMLPYLNGGSWCTVSAGSSQSSIKLSVLLSWLSLPCHIKKQRVLPVSVRFS